MTDVIWGFAEARRLIEWAQTEAEAGASQQLMADFLNLECELAATLAQIALDSFAAGHVDRGTAAAAKEGHETVLRLRLRLKDDGAREQIESILVALDPLIGKLEKIR